MYKINFTVKDLNGFSFNIEDAGKVLKPDNGDSFLMESLGDDSGEYGYCFFCGKCDLEANLNPCDADYNGSHLAVNACGKCLSKEIRLKHSDAWVGETPDQEFSRLMDELETRHAPGRPQRNPGGPDESPFF